MSVDWAHPIGEVISVLIEAGLRLEFFHEHDYTLFPRFSVMERDAGGKPEWRLPEGMPKRAADVLVAGFEAGCRLSTG